MLWLLRADDDIEPPRNIEAVATARDVVAVVDAFPAVSEKCYADAAGTACASFLRHPFLRPSYLSPIVSPVLAAAGLLAILGVLGSVRRNALVAGLGCSLSVFTASEYRAARRCPQ